MEKPDTRSIIIGEADRLFYQQGFEPTSFSDIASSVGISRGNFYYHFKTKDEILEAVIDLRLRNTVGMLAAWEKQGETPADRLKCFIKILIRNQAKIMAYGCPVGTLSNELSKLDHPSKADAARIFSLFKDWLARQFKAMGRKTDAETLALHILGRSQGVASLATAFKDKDYVHSEVDQICRWIDSIEHARDSNSEYSNRGS
ncbi:TetR/AcrR family transcriptional regulator [Aestuariispira insulae]|uniref:TetR family transcriptional regulator n=1 Tax=Aestuariispira insulae TaxID=1461337 RepID=A0A3D9HXK1_9PROT|nr:TetR/AcrR family transcriptional regulator [Aestuariispira insulae]RED54233.1 TetR family transcriptional regulator [Aestuariispira insulae]